MTETRPGPAALDSWIRRYGRVPSPDLDRICAQKDAHTSLLYWFTDLTEATREASGRSGRRSCAG